MKTGLRAALKAAEDENAGKKVAADRLLKQIKSWAPDGIDQIVKSYAESDHPRDLQMAKNLVALASAAGMKRVWEWKQFAGKPSAAFGTALIAASLAVDCGKQDGDNIAIRRDRYDKIARHAEALAREIKLLEPDLRLIPSYYGLSGDEFYTYLVALRKLATKESECLEELADLHGDKDDATLGARIFVKKLDAFVKQVAGKKLRREDMLTVLKILLGVNYQPESLSRLRKTEKKK